MWEKERERGKRKRERERGGVLLLDLVSIRYDKLRVTVLLYLEFDLFTYICLYTRSACV